ncbi:MAG: bifunctional 2-polyprenyl-6-hydroxyphenol methylase/3-demethylubiquinol 3-O-methyltransferase UbiG [Novosphingopyxis baekryungensis]|jgi:2-polyprenyl-6-hydroxyphenyl methylase/3-demethylubiquinone-9 3-methyltransferase|nr:bifunctional 2-polyprenyl-6-hydroxyphenol methylase/3-demethylubiquinol 3-O-methyltransferase UbiG [Novosphingopyxis baekryungensis]
MSKASIATINPAEAAHFGKMAADWWDPKGSSAMLHKLNPVRLRYIRRHIDRHFACDKCEWTPLEGRTALDVGCGAGLLAEPLARLGAAVTAIDAAPENIAAAQAHAAQSRLTIDYRAEPVETLEAGPFDLVTCMEVIEHVDSPDHFAAALAGKLTDGGLLILSTPNRTPASRALLVEGAERLGQIPRGTHDWDKFLTPEECEALLTDAGLTVIDSEGIAFGPGQGLHLSDNKMLNYILAAVKS